MKYHLNLLPWKCRRKQILRLRWMQWLVPMGFVASFLVTAVAVRAWQYREIHGRVGQLEEYCEPLSLLRKEIGKMHALDAEVARRETLLSELEDPRPTLSLLGLVSRSAERCRGRLRVEYLGSRPVGGATAPAQPAPTPTAPGATPATSTTGLVIRGIAADNVAVAEFVRALSETKAFDKVELKSSLENSKDGDRTCAYLVECSY